MEISESQSGLPKIKEDYPACMKFIMVYEGLEGFWKIIEIGKINDGLSGLRRIMTD